MPGIPRSLPEIIRRTLNGELSGMHVALPGKVVAYNATTNLADVQVMIQQSVWDDDGNRTYEDVGTLPGVPVQWPRGGGFKMTLPLAAGDFGALIFCSDGIGEWRTSGQSSQPADTRRMSIGWPFFSPGLFPDTQPPSPGDPGGSKAIWGADGGNGQIRATATTLELGPNPTSPIALATPLDAWIVKVCAALTALQTSDAAIQAQIAKILADAASTHTPITKTDDIATVITPTVSGAATTAVSNGATAVTAAATPPTIDSTLVKSL